MWVHNDKIGIRERSKPRAQRCRVVAREQRRLGSRFGTPFPAIAPMLVATYQAAPSLTFKVSLERRSTDASAIAVAAPGSPDNSSVIAR